MKNHIIGGGASLIGLRFPGDTARFEREGFTLRVRVEADETSDIDGAVGVVVEVVEHVTVDYRPKSAYRYEHDVVLADASLWGIDTLEGGYGKDVVEQLAPEAIEHARRVLLALRALKRKAGKDRT